MSSFRHWASISVGLLALAATPACKRSPAEDARARGSAVDDDVKDVAKATKKTAQDLGHAAAEAADKAGTGIADATKKVAAGSEDAWITTKVKSELAREGFEPLGLHVDTERKVVTLSGTVDSAPRREKAVALARGVKDVAGVIDHLFVQPPAAK